VAIRHEHDWVLIVPDPVDHPRRGVQQCVCGAEVDRIHPVPAANRDADVDDALERSIFGPLASGVVKRRRQPTPVSDLAPTFMEPS
jgi:hypothetical protein